jgi:hypothetical protein
MGVKEMTREESLSLRNGLYRIYWKKNEGGGTSLAAIGILENGYRWIAPINWVHPSEIQDVWELIEEVEELGIR